MNRLRACSGMSPYDNHYFCEILMASRRVGLKSPVSQNIFWMNVLPQPLHASCTSHQTRLRASDIENTCIAIKSRVKHHCHVPPPSLSAFPQDEKALSFFSTVPQKWRLFWAIYTVAISFALALVGLRYVGTALRSIDDDTGNYDSVLLDVPGWFVCVVNPGTVTVLSFFLSDAVRTFTQFCCQKGSAAGILKMVKERYQGAVTGAKCFLREGPIFSVVLCLWLAHGVYSWWFLLQEFWGSKLECSSFSITDGSRFEYSSNFTSVSLDIAIRSSFSSDGSYELYLALVVATVALVTGMVLNVLVLLMSRQPCPSIIEEPTKQSSELVDAHTRQVCCGTSKRFRLLSLLIGWGIGYWITSGLMGGTLHRGDWNDTPPALAVAGYIILPCFFLAVVIVKADCSVLGTTFEPFMEKVESVLNNQSGPWFWILATAIRDAVSVWVFMWRLLVPCLNNI